MPTTKRPRRKTPVDHDPKALKRARIRAGLRQFELAAELGISPSTLCEAEKGTRGLRPNVRTELAKRLSCDPISFAPITSRAA
jgi:transcriptional regulator with XRE-family HTH domain